jgi:hypothetical protein
MDSSSPVNHTIPGLFMVAEPEIRREIMGVDKILEKWDSIMNDASLPAADREFFKQSFFGYMQEIERKEGFGPSSGEGFDDLLRAIETGDIDSMKGILTDAEDMKELQWAFAEAFKKAVETTGVEVGTEQDRLSGLLMRNDWAGLDCVNGRKKTSRKE